MPTKLHSLGQDTGIAKMAELYRGRRRCRSWAKEFSVEVGGWGVNRPNTSTAETERGWENLEASDHFDMLMSTSAICPSCKT